MIAVLPLIYVIALCASLSHSFPGARQYFFLSFAGRLHEVANWNFYWFNSFNWIICILDDCSPHFAGMRHHSEKTNATTFFAFWYFYAFQSIETESKRESSRCLSRVYFVGKIENAFESAHFFSFVRWGETSMSSCDSNVLGQTARSTLICFTVFARHIGDFFSNFIPPYKK